MKTFLSSVALLTGLTALVDTPAFSQTAVATVARAASRLDQMLLDPVTDTNATGAGATVNQATSPRLGGIQLAQIPKQPVIRPGQNPAISQPGGIRPIGTPPVPTRTLPPSGPSRVPTSAPAGSPTPPPLAGKPIQPPTSPQPAPPINPQPAPASGTGSGDEEMVSITFQAVPLPQVLLKYEEWTGKKVIRDQNVEQVTITIDTTGELPKKEAIDFIERWLLLNGYGFIPAGDKFVKFMNFAALKPGVEGPLLYMKTSDLPLDGEVIATFIQPLKYLEPDDLKKTLSELVQLHPYGVVTPLPNAKGVAITENTNTIRYIIRLLESLDTPPVPTEQRSFQITRASAEDVAKALADILDIEGKGSSGGSSGGSGGKKTPSGNPNPIPNPIPGQPQPNGQPAAAAARTGVYGNAPQAASTPPKLITIPRTNKLLVVAKVADLDYISKLIEELDGPAEIRNFISRPLRYLTANEVLPIIKDAISRGEEEGGSSGGSSGGSIVGKNNSNSGQNGINNSRGTNSRSGSGIGGSSGFGGSSGIGGMGGYGGGSGFGGGGGFGGSGGGLQAMRQSNNPESLVVGKTLLIADPVQNTIFASGAPEHLRALGEILDELDKRPRSVVLSVVIGQLKLEDDKDFGIDYIFKPQQLAAGKWNANVAGTSKNRVGVGQDLLDPNSLLGFSDLAKSMPSGIQFFGTIQDQVNFAMSALAKNTNFKILSRPTLYTMNNEPASINTGLRVPYASGSVNNLNTTTNPNGQLSNGVYGQTNYMDVTLRLDVSPLINSDDELTLQIQQVNDDIAGTTVVNGNATPTISHQGLDTKIMVKNNATVLLGGLIQETKDKEHGGIPILKDIPIIKYLAGSTKDKTLRQELLVFIQPRILSGNDAMPPSPAEGAGSSPLGDDAKKFFNQEHSDPDTATTKVQRTRVGRLLHKLFE